MKRLFCILFLSALSAPAQSFEVASVKPAAPADRIDCSGGPATSSPGLWRCSNVPLGFVITQAYDFQAYQFPPNSPCCQARFDFEAKIPPGASKAQFRHMLQNLLADRFHLKLHLDKKEMPVFALTIAESGLKMRESPPGDAPQQDPWSPTPSTKGKDDYPEFPSGRPGLAGNGGRYHWIAFQAGMDEIVKTLSFHLGRPVVDETGLKGKYDIDLRWVIDIAWVMEQAGLKDQIPPEAKNTPTGPNLMHAVQDQLGLKLTSKKGTGEMVVIDHLDKVPTAN